MTVGCEASTQQGRNFAQHQIASDAGRLLSEYHRPRGQTMRQGCRKVLSVAIMKAHLWLMMYLLE